MRIDVLTLFPEMFEGVLGSSILKRAASAVGPDGKVVEPPAGSSSPSSPSPSPLWSAAAEEGVRPPVVSYHIWNMRDFTRDRHDRVDKPPFGGGPGMVIQCQPVWDTVMAAEAAGREQLGESGSPLRVLLTPQGRRLEQLRVMELSAQPWLLLIAGHYEGLDERVIEALRERGGLEELSIGDYVVSGGELPAMVLIDAVVRLQPGVLGNEASAVAESFSPELRGGLDFPHYTRPVEWEGRSVPEVLRSGNHAKIEAWRREAAERRTLQRRPDLA